MLIFSSFNLAKWQKKKQKRREDFCALILLYLLVKNPVIQVTDVRLSLANNEIAEAENLHKFIPRLCNFFCSFYSHTGSSMKSMIISPRHLINLPAIAPRNAVSLSVFRATVEMFESVLRFIWCLSLKKKKPYARDAFEIDGLQLTLS